MGGAETRSPLPQHSLRLARLFEGVLVGGRRPGSIDRVERRLLGAGGAGTAAVLVCSAKANFFRRLKRLSDSLMSPVLVRSLKAGLLGVVGLRVAVMPELHWRVSKPGRPEARPFAHRGGL